MLSAAVLTIGQQIVVRASGMSYLEFLKNVPQAFFG
jgi:hypothetical protein